MDTLARTFIVLIALAKVFDHSGMTCARAGEGSPVSL